MTDTSTEITVQRVLDISSFQGEVNFPAIKAAGIAGVMCKATEGVGFTDPRLVANWAGIKATGLVRGCYGFARPDLGNQPEAEAAWLLSQVGALDTGDILSLDIEVGSGDLSPWALAWLHYVEMRAGYPPLPYSDLDFITHHLQAPELAAYPLWLAAYEAQCPASCAPWTSVAMWQHTSQATYAGIHGYVDESLIARDLAGLRALGKPAAAVTPDLAPSRGDGSVPASSYRVTMAQALRAKPDALSARGALIPAGDTVYPVAGGPGIETWTPHWRLVHTGAGQQGWFLMSHLAPITR